MKKKYNLSVLAPALALFVCLTAFEPSDVVRDRCILQQEIAADCSQFMDGGAGQAKNVILLIGDGMGVNQIFAGRVYLEGPEGSLSWEGLPHKGLVTSCAIHQITDSAASGTAIATGHKTTVGTVSMGHGTNAESYLTILEEVKTRKATGLVTNTDLWDATPAVFAAHAPRRSQSEEIARQMIEKTRPDVLLGGGEKAFRGSGGTDMVERAKELGYTYVDNRSELLALDPDKTDRLLGLFAEGSMVYELESPEEKGQPHLSEMARAALDVLDNDQRGLFIMIEGARIDHTCHAVDEDRLVLEMAEFNKTVELALDWAGEHPDTLVLVTADHETGGIEVKPGDYQKGDKVSIRWTAAFLNLYANHSSQRVPIFGEGPNAGAIKDNMDNTGVYCIMKNAFGVP